MSGKIYCYGGLLFTTATENKVDNVMNVLDITNKTDITSDSLQNLWKSVSYIGNNVDLTPRTDPQCVVISDQNRMIVNGGYVSATTKLENMTAVYDALQNKWLAHPDYTEDPYGKRQMLVHLFMSFDVLLIGSTCVDTGALVAMCLEKALRTLADLKSLYYLYSQAKFTKILIPSLMQIHQCQLDGTLHKHFYLYLCRWPIKNHRLHSSILLEYR